MNKEKEEFDMAVKIIIKRIVPENKVSRSYRDMVGACNQVIASKADQVIMMVSGVPLHLKK